MSNGLTAQIILNFDPARPDEAAELCDVFSALLLALRKDGAATTIMSPAPGPDGPDDDEPLPLDAGPSPSPKEPVQPAKRVRDRTAERRAAKEKAEAEAKAKQAQGNGHVDTDDPLVGGGEFSGTHGTGDPFGDDVEDQPAPAAKPAEPRDRVRTPKECMDGAVVLLRQTWGAGGGDAVKALQKTYQVAKFADVPLDKAPGLWKEALALAQKFKVNIPAGL